VDQLETRDPEVGWNEVWFKYQRLHGRLIKAASFDSTEYLDDYGVLRVAWNPAMDTDRAIYYQSYKFTSKGSGWLKCISKSPFIGMWVPELQFQFNYKGEGHPPRMVVLTRSFDDHDKLCYVGSDYRDRTIQVQPYQQYTIELQGSTLIRLPQPLFEKWGLKLTGYMNQPITSDDIGEPRASERTENTSFTVVHSSYLEALP
jgi:hypothetical protein